MHNTKVKKFVIILIVAVLFLGIGSIISYSNFRVANPFLSASALYKVLFTETEYVQLQEYPQVLIAKPDGSLDEYMLEKGDYKELEEAQQGALHIYSNGDSMDYIMVSVNKYFSLWSWRE